MRLIFAAIVLTLPAVAAAQSALTAFPPLPSIGLPLPSIGLGLSPLGLTPADPPRRGDFPARGPEQQHPRGPRRGVRPAPTIVYFMPAYGWGTYLPGQTATPAAEPAKVAPPEPKPASGRLRLEVQPAGPLDLYVDGYFLGTTDDFNGEVDLEAGPHALEIRAIGYEPLAFEVKITAGRSITYRGALKPVAAAAPSVARNFGSGMNEAKSASQVAAPIAPTTIYFIPGCYLGNVPPTEVAALTNCDLSQLITRKP